MEKCNKDCLNCTIQKCIYDRQKSSNLPPKRRDRTDYDAKYYQDNIVARKKEFRQNYLKRKHPGIQVCDVSYIEVYHTISKIKKQLGEDNFNLVVNQIEKCLGR